ncbi:MAG: hypothetical protein V4733_08360 [Verrucomicrobiota bacterium]
MKRSMALAVCAGVFLAACKRNEEVTVTETRGPTTRDTPPKLNATSDERFRDAKPSPVRGETPAGWQPLPPSQFRLLNYRFGGTGSGEVWVSLSAGSIKDNVNRWLAQFGAAALDDAGVAALRKVEIADFQGVWVEAKGTYSGGMGAPPQEGQALAGVIAKLDGKILTVKMVGPETDVAEGKATLETYAKNLKVIE